VLIRSGVAANGLGDRSICCHPHLSPATAEPQSRQDRSGPPYQQTGDVAGSRGEADDNPKDARAVAEKGAEVKRIDITRESNGPGRQSKDWTIKSYLATTDQLSGRRRHPSDPDWSAVRARSSQADESNPFGILGVEPDHRRCRGDAEAMSRANHLDPLPHFQLVYSGLNSFLIS